MFIGILGFFTVMIFVATVRSELHGDPSVVQALALAVMVGLVAFTWRMRGRLVSPAAGTHSGRDGDAGPEAGA
jgi:hypothetical protein